MQLDPVRCDACLSMDKVKEANAGNADHAAIWKAGGTTVMDLDAQAVGPKVEGSGFAASFGPYEVKRYLIR